MLNWLKGKRPVDPWLVVAVEGEGLPLILRIRQSVPAAVRTDALPHLLKIMWEYDEDETGGMPPAADLDRMNDLEERLNKLDDSILGCLVAIITGDDVRQWLWYVSDSSDYMEHLNAALAGVAEPFPVSFELYDEPGWETYHGLLAGAAQ